MIVSHRDLFCPKSVQRNLSESKKLVVWGRKHTLSPCATGVQRILFLTIPCWFKMEYGASKKPYDHWVFDFLSKERSGLGKPGFWCRRRDLIFADEHGDVADSVSSLYLIPRSQQPNAVKTPSAKEITCVTIVAASTNGRIEIRIGLLLAIA